MNIMDFCFRNAENTMRITRYDRLTHERIFLNPANFTFYPLGIGDESDGTFSTIIKSPCNLSLYNRSISNFKIYSGHEVFVAARFRLKIKYFDSVDRFYFRFKRRFLKFQGGFVPLYIRIQGLRRKRIRKGDPLCRIICQQVVD